jgi:hypothetical protein
MVSSSHTVKKKKKAKRKRSEGFVSRAAVIVVYPTTSYSCVSSSYLTSYLSCCLVPGVFLLRISCHSTMLFPPFSLYSHSSTSMAKHATATAAAATKEEMTIKTNTTRIQTRKMRTMPRKILVIRPGDLPAVSPRVCYNYPRNKCFTVIGCSKRVRCY